jgi:O-antigen/teichoic acid export membrane protein
MTSIPGGEPPPEAVDVLRTPEAGGMVIRGGALRVVGYGAAVFFAAITSVFLLRYLDVRDFGLYGVVAALLGIVSALTEAGLNAIGSRELAVRSPRERSGVLGTYVGMRVLLTGAGVLAAALAAVVLGYEEVVVLGTLLAGIGVVLVNTQTTLTLPLRVELRQGLIAAVEVQNQALACLLVGLLVLASAELLAFFSVQIAVGVAAVAVTLALASSSRVRPSLERRATWSLVRESLPLAAAVAMNAVYLRLLVVFVSLLTTATATGLFATSFRVVEMLIGLPTILLAVALPLLAVAAADDRLRFRYGMQRMTELALVAGLLQALVTAVLAEPAIRLIADPEYLGAAEILQIQAFALVGVYMAQTWTLCLVSLRRQREVAIANAIALLTVVVLGVVLIPAFGTTGAAAAGVATEAVLAALLFVFLRLREPALAPTLRFVWRPALALAAGSAVLLVPGVSGWLAGVLAGTVFLAAGFAVRAVPAEILPALRGRA